MPLVFAAAMGGNLSLIGAPGNMIAHTTLDKAEVPTFGFFEYAIVGEPILIVGILFYATLGFYLLPNPMLRRVEVFSILRKILVQFQYGRKNFGAGDYIRFSYL